MRLLSVNTRQLEEFFGDAVPPYAILSHTWGAEEVTFQDLAREGHRRKQGYNKIEGCCQQAVSQGLAYVWIDTCCIDKTSSSELSEAINSMFQWYAAARVCYAYLQDVPPGLDPFDRDSDFQRSRWFTRGWTLQELVAPRQIEFYASDWTPVFPLYATWTAETQPVTPRKKIALLSGITRIPESVLRKSHHLSLVSAACKFSWAADRRTTRIEDEAYSLLGLLGINMPLLYGEGSKAFLRLQEVVLSSSDDISVLAWGYDLSWKFMRDEYQASILARSPEAFLGIPRANLQHTRRTPKVHTTMTGHGLHIELSMVNLDARNKVWLGIIEEELRYHESIQVRHVGIAIVLKQRTGMSANIFERVGGCPPIRIFERHLRRRFRQTTTRKLIYLQDSGATSFRPTDTDVGKSLRSYLQPGYRLLSLAKPAPSISMSLSLINGALFGPAKPAPGISMSLSLINGAGYFLSSLWPPTVQYQIITPLRPDQPYGWLNFQGPQNSVFHTIFANDRQNRFLVRTKVQWGKDVVKSFEVTFCKLDPSYHGTAVEHCCKSRVGWRAPQFNENMQWSRYISMENKVTHESGHIRITSFRNGERVGCSLDWLKGTYMDEV
jgi:hypothetical protein